MAETGNFYKYQLVTCTTALLNRWNVVTSLLDSRDGITIINQGVSNDMTTPCLIEIVALNTADTAPTTSATNGIIIGTGDSIKYKIETWANVYWKTTTTNATLMITEYQMKVE